MNKMGVKIYNELDLKEVNEKKNQENVKQSLIFAELFEKIEKDKLDIMNAIAEVYEMKLEEK